MHYSSESVEVLVEQFMKLPTIGRKTAQRLASYVLKMPRSEVVEIAKALVDVKDRVKQCSICFNVTDNDPCPICASHRRDHSIICVVEDANDVLALERTNEYRGVYHVLGGVISPLDGIGPEDLHIRPLVGRIDPEFRKMSSETNGFDIDTEGSGGSERSSANDVDGIGETGESAGRSGGSDGPAGGAGGAEGAARASGSSEGVAGESGASESAADGSGVSEAAAEYGRGVDVSEVILALNPNVEGDTTAYYISQLLKPHGVRITRIARGLPIGGDLEYADEATLSRALEGRSAL